MKKLIVFGATGGTGKKVVEQALQSGLNVKVIVRNPEMFSIKHPHLEIIKGDVLQASTFKNEIAGSDAVISCLGIPKIQQTTLYSMGIQNIINSMQEVGITRILCISSGAISTPPNSSFIMRFLLKNVLQRLYKPVYADMQRMEDLLQVSSLNWTAVRAPKLTDGKLTKRYRNITGQPLRSIPTISRADMADYMLTHLTDSATYKTKVEIAY